MSVFFEPLVFFTEVAGVPLTSVSSIFSSFETFFGVMNASSLVVCVGLDWTFDEARRLLFLAFSDLTGVVELIESSASCPFTDLPIVILLTGGGPRRGFLRAFSVPDCIMAGEALKCVKGDWQARRW